MFGKLIEIDQVAVWDKMLVELLKINDFSNLRTNQPTSLPG